MENTIQVKAVRTFHGDEGFKSPASQPFEVSRQRFADLKANGLVEEFKGVPSALGDTEQKAAQAHANKMAVPSKNKAAGGAQD